MDIEFMPFLLGLLAGISLGLLCGIPKEEKIKYAAVGAVFGPIMVTAIGVIFYSYGYSFLFGYLIGFITTYLVGLRYRSQKDKRRHHFFCATGISEYEKAEIRQKGPKVDPKLVLHPNILLGYRLEISLKMENVSNETLDKLSVELNILDLNLKTKKKEKKVSTYNNLPNLFPQEEITFNIKERIGHYQSFVVNLKIYREFRGNSILISEFHWK